jgi:predicted XRE-type DNA-binding protein
MVDMGVVTCDQTSAVGSEVQAAATAAFGIGAAAPDSVRRHEASSWNAPRRGGSATGHRTFTDLAQAFKPTRHARIAEKAAALREQMSLEELHNSREFSQEEVAAALAVGQPAIAKLEKRADMRLSNLRRNVEALGGRLEITARFGEESVVADVGEEAA